MLDLISLLAIITSLFTMSSAFAAPKTFKFDEEARIDEVRIDVPFAWKAARDLYGVPLFLLGPVRNEERPTLAVTPTGISDLRFDETALKQDEAQYQKGRAEWLKNRGGELNSYLPYVVDAKNTKRIVHSIGVFYTIRSLSFVERSYYIFCGKKSYHLKSLNLTSDVESAKLLSGAVETFHCLR